MTQRETLEDVYTRKVGGEQYQYKLEYSSGSTVFWNAEVFKDGALKGTPRGALSDNLLKGPALRQIVITMVEISIENMQGIAE